MTIFRPCIDLHQGQVKQIVGGTLSSDETVVTNYVSSHSAGYYANLYKEHNLTGAHVIKLGPGNDEAAEEALSTWPGALQIGGGITIDNAAKWIDSGAKQVIVTSWLFPNGAFDENRLRQLSEKIGSNALVVDLSCRRSDDKWQVYTNRWQTPSGFYLGEESMDMIANYASEFLIHAADVEGLCKGIDEELVQNLGKWSKLPCTYAGGGQSISDLQLVSSLSGGKVDLTFGSALDIFGGNLVKFSDAVDWNKTQAHR